MFKWIKENPISVVAAVAIITVLVIAGIANLAALLAFLGGVFGACAVVGMIAGIMWEAEKREERNYNKRMDELAKARSESA